MQGHGTVLAYSLRECWKLKGCGFEALWFCTFSAKGLHNVVRIFKISCLPRSYFLWKAKGIASGSRSCNPTWDMIDSDRSNDMSLQFYIYMSISIYIYTLWIYIVYIYIHITWRCLNIEYAPKMSNSIGKMMCWSIGFGGTIFSDKPKQRSFLISRTYPQPIHIWDVKYRKMYICIDGLWQTYITICDIPCVST